MNLPWPWFLASVAARTAIVLLALLVGIRITGKRGMGGLNILDLVMVLLLGNAVQNALTYGSGELGVGLVSVGTLLLLDRLIGRVLTRQPWLEKQLVGEPRIILQNGQLDAEAMRHENVTEDEVLAAMRDIGVDDLSQVRLGVLEDDGSISIVPREPKA